MVNRLHGLFLICFSLSITFAGSPKGSSLARAKNDGQPISKKIYFTAYDYLVSTNRSTCGRGYTGMKNAMARLVGTSNKVQSLVELHKKKDIYGS